MINNEEIKEGEFLPDFMKKNKEDFKLLENFLMIPENKLDSLPKDWFDFIFYLVAYNYGISTDFLIMLDDDQTKKAMEFVEKDEFNLYVFSSDRKHIWEIHIIRCNGKPVYHGGENLRIFLDKKNIYYKSFVSESGLISGTTMEYEKEDGEDCRIPTKQKD